MESRVDAASGKTQPESVAAHLEGEDPREVGLERRRHQVHHQVHVFVEGVGHANRRFRHVARLAAAVVCLDVLDPALDFTHIGEVPVEPVPVAGSELAPDVGDLPGHPVENAGVQLAPVRPVLRRVAHAEQLVEDGARVTNRRQRLGRRGPRIVSV